jgi:hypothetical protein
MFDAKKGYMLLCLFSFTYAVGMDDHHLTRDQLEIMSIQSNNDNANMFYGSTRWIDAALNAYLTYDCLSSGDYFYATTTGVRVVMSSIDALNCIRARKVLQQLIDNESVDPTTLSHYVYKTRPEFLTHIMFGISFLRTACEAPTLFSQNWIELLWNTGLDVGGDFVRGLHELHESKVKQLKKHS